jgi:hypothetical protein
MLIVVQLNIPLGGTFRFVAAEIFIAPYEPSLPESNCAISGAAASTKHPETNFVYRESLPSFMI